MPIPKYSVWVLQHATVIWLVFLFLFCFCLFGTYLLFVFVLVFLETNMLLLYNPLENQFWCFHELYLPHSYYGAVISKIPRLFQENYSHFSIHYAHWWEGENSFCGFGDISRPRLWETGVRWATGKFDIMPISRHPLMRLLYLKVMIIRHISPLFSVLRIRRVVWFSGTWWALLWKKLFSSF